MGKIEIKGDEEEDETEPEDIDDPDEKETTDSENSNSWTDPGYPTPGQDLDNAIGVFGPDNILGTKSQPLLYGDGYVPSFICCLVRQFYKDHGCDIKAFMIKDITAFVKKSLLIDGFNLSPNCNDNELADGIKEYLDMSFIEYKH